MTDDGMDYQTEILKEIRRDVRLVKVAVFGNGEVGLAEEVRALKHWRKAMDRGGQTWAARGWTLVLTAIGAALGVVSTLIVAGLT